MNPWPFVVAAYSAAILLTGGLVLWAWAGMRRAEAAAESVARK